MNEYRETSVDHVWAAGDIAKYPDRIFRRRMRIEHWDNAVEQGRVAMRNMMDKFQPFIHVPHFLADEFDLSYEYRGDAKGYDQVVYRGEMKKKQLSVWWLKKGMLCAALLMNRPNEERQYAPRWILGARSSIPTHSERRRAWGRWIVRSVRTGGGYPLRRLHLSYGSKKSRGRGFPQYVLLPMRVTLTVDSDSVTTWRTYDETNS